MNIRRWVLITALVFGTGLSGQAAETAADIPILIRNATVYTVSSGVLTGASILIRNGRIVEVGKSMAAPDGATLIDGTGKHVIPGIIDCHSHIAIDGNVNENTLSVTSMVGVDDVINPTDPTIYLDLAGGVTTANVLHGSANAVGGRNAVIKLRWGNNASGLLFEGAKPGIKLALGENPKRSNVVTSREARRYPATRMGVEDVIREAFTQARRYMDDWEAYRKRSGAGDTGALPPKEDLKLEPLAEVLRGERLVHAHCYRADEILMLLRIANDFGFKVTTFQHVLEGYKVAREIAAHGAGASTFSDWWAYKVEAYDAIPQNAVIMTRKGVLVSLNSDSAEVARHLNQEAGKMMKYGLSEAEALKLVTLNPARQLQIDNRVGTIEPGKDADLVMYDRPPLSIYAVPEKVFIDGQIYFDRDRDMARRQEVAKEKESLKRARREPTTDPMR